MPPAVPTTGVAADAGAGLPAGAPVSSAPSTSSPANTHAVTIDRRPEGFSRTVRPLAVVTSWPESDVSYRVRLTSLSTGVDILFSFTLE